VSISAHVAAACRAVNVGGHGSVWYIHV